MDYEAIDREASRHVIRLTRPDRPYYEGWVTDNESEALSRSDKAKQYRDSLAACQAADRLAPHFKAMGWDLVVESAVTLWNRED